MKRIIRIFTLAVFAAAVFALAACESEDQNITITAEGDDTQAETKEKKEDEEEKKWLLVDSERLIMQTYSRKEEPGEFIQNPTLFTLESGEIVKIELYIWLEGQDVDCSNAMSDGVTTTKLEANIQFTGTSGSQSGMEPIQME